MNPTPPCINCGTPVEMPFGPHMIRFSQGIGSTAIVIEHPEQIQCPACGAILHLVINGIQNIQMKTAAVPAQKRQLVVPLTRKLVG